MRRVVWLWWKWRGGGVLAFGGLEVIIEGGRGGRRWGDGNGEDGMGWGD